MPWSGSLPAFRTRKPARTHLRQPTHPITRTERSMPREGVLRLTLQSRCKGRQMQWLSTTEFKLRVVREAEEVRTQRSGPTI